MSPPNDQNAIESAAPRGRRSLLRSVARIIAAVYLGLLGILMIFENRLIYPAPKYSQPMWSRCRKMADAQAVTIDGESDKVVAWLFQPTPANEDVAEPTTVRRFGMFFHGNGDSLPGCCSFVRRIADEMKMTILAVEYPGYGPYETSVSERGICECANTALDSFCRRFEIAPTDVVQIGQSLGGGAAMSIAENGSSRAIVLLSTYSSLPDVAADKYPFFPVRLVMRNRFPSQDRIKTCPQPLLQFHGDADRLIPICFAEKLFKSSPSDQKRFVTFEGGGHNHVAMNRFLTELREFLEDIESN